MSRNTKKYSKLKRITLSKDILKNDAAIYSSPFGAIAEFADNSRDANAKSFKISTISTPEYLVKYGLCFLDDGHGMTPKALEDAICYGKSIKRSSEKIGKFGVGLKSASMRLASNMILFTKSKLENGETVQSILLLSDTFNTEIDESEPVVAMPSFKIDGYSPYYAQLESREIFLEEIELINKYSPFKTFNQIADQFNKITTPSGTLIICYDLKFSNSSHILKIDENKHDILINDYSPSFEDLLKFELESLRSLMTILYYKPNMKIYILGKKVKTKLMNFSLAKPKRVVDYEIKSLNQAKLAELKSAESEVKLAEEERSTVENNLK